MSQSIATCPACKRELPVIGAAFCPYCGASLTSEENPKVRDLLAAAMKTTDPVRKHELLLAARKEYPDCLSVEKELLHLGRLYQRDARAPRFDVIKCYLIQFYLTPKEFSADQRNAMRQELFEDEQLKRCQSLAPDAEGFTRDYLIRLSEEFIQLFLESSNYYMRSFFGITNRKGAPKYLADPAAQILINMRGDQGLSKERQALLSHAFYTAFSNRMNGEIAPLDEELEKAGYPRPF
ncbi:MAG: zinc ribbon domain-containing protein [Eubacteriales bacterium]|nr:zinc ribbon domain-containing protein [Eubacteriales bacterium]